MKKIFCKIVDFAVPADNRIKLKEWEEKDKYPDLARELKLEVRRTRHAGHCWRSRDELIRDVLLWTPSHGRQKQDDQHEHTFSSYVRMNKLEKIYKMSQNRSNPLI